MYVKKYTDGMANSVDADQTAPCPDLSVHYSTGLAVSVAAVGIAHYPSNIMEIWCWFYCAPNFEEVDRAYWFRVVRCPSIH